MQGHSAIRRTLAELHTRLTQVRQAYSLSDYENLLQFQVKILPRLLGAERCSIFIPDLASGDIWLKFGTGLEERQIVAPSNGSIVGRVITTGQVAIENHLDQQVGFHNRADSATGFVTRNLICVPIKSLLSHEVTGAVQVLNKLENRLFGQEDLDLLGEMAGHISLVLENILIHQNILELSDKLAGDVQWNPETATFTNSPFIAASQAMREVMALARMVGYLPVNVFIQGENGTGKELVARLIHQTSHQGKRPFVAVNCAAIPESLIESEFFGYDKGAFTGADSSRKGRFEEAEEGVLFLDEVGEMPLSIQPKFLRAIQEREGTRLGSNKVIPYNFRLISATNADIRQRVAEGRFRQDLYYRLYSVEILIPPLRERREDILPMTMAFLDETSRRFNKWVNGLAKEVIDLFEQYSWPGNVRQLRQEVERLVALTPDGKDAQVISCSEALRHFLQQAPTGAADCTLSLPEQVNLLEIRLIRQALEQTRDNKVHASRQLGITRQGLHNKMARYGIH